MRIIYDGHIFRWQKVGGISRYFREIILGLPNEWIPTLLGGGDSHYLPAHPKLVASATCAIRPRRFSQPLKSLWWKVGYLQQSSLFHPTYYSLTGGLRYQDVGCPVVITVHDLIAAAYPDLEDNSAATSRDLSSAVAAAAHAICVSRSTECHLHEKYPCLVGRTSVIYHGSSFAVSLETQPDEIFEKPTFLYVGRRATYKNFQLLLRAFAKACQSNPAIRLCVAGAPLSQDEKWEIHFLGVSSRVDSITYPSEQLLQQLYRGSVALLYPSRHEGFGIPPLEAMACGTLAVTSNTTSLPEVVGDAGIMLDPTDEGEWTECILSIASQKVPRQDLLQRGRLRATELSWESSARRHVELYKQLA